MASAGGLGREVQAGADGSQGQSDVVVVGSAQAFIPPGVAFRACRPRVRALLGACVRARLGSDADDFRTRVGADKIAAPDRAMGRPRGRGRMADPGGDRYRAE